MTYGPTCEEALAAVKALALRVLADKLEHGEISSPQENIFAAIWSSGCFRPVVSTI
jgi:hypothetical protein